MSNTDEFPGISFASNILLDLEPKKQETSKANGHKQKHSNRGLLSGPGKSLLRQKTLNPNHSNLAKQQKRRCSVTPFHHPRPRRGSLLYPYLSAMKHFCQPNRNAGRRCLVWTWMHHACLAVMRGPSLLYVKEAVWVTWTSILSGKRKMLSLFPARPIKTEDLNKRQFENIKIS